MASSRAVDPCTLALAVASRPFVGARTSCPLAGGQVMAGRSCRRPGRGWPPILLLAAFAAKTQQERVERFYAFKSHHTQFKTNLSYENLGSDATIGKPQRVHHMRRRLYIPVFQIRMEKMKEVRHPPL
ncbi:hypothetical protein BHE74_00056865 [Ensete ventricosum]|nr:hypothetical protein BHE74_00056865 [Ensete ventricosum]RZS23579.1 hypothetical protein BHM03_00056542 [Ensete ventricosum]